MAVKVSKEQYESAKKENAKYSGKASEVASYIIDRPSILKSALVPNLATMQEYEAQQKYFPELAEPVSPLAEKSPFLQAEAQAEQNQSAQASKSYFAQMDENLMSGLPGYPSDIFESAAKTQGKMAKSEAEKTSKASQASQLELQNFETLITKQIGLQNDIYTDWLNSNKQAQRGIDEVQEKYPVLSRADIIANMSTGEKITTSVLTALGAVFRNKQDQNPALNALNKTMDESIAQQSLTYDREMKNLLNKKLLDDKTFETSIEQAKNTLQMQQSSLETALKIVDLSRLEKSSDELQGVEDNAKNAILMQNATAKMNYDLQVFGFSQKSKMFRAKILLEEGKRAWGVKVPELIDGKVQYSQIKYGLTKKGIERKDFGEGYGSRNKKIDALSKIKSLAEINPNAREFDILIKQFNADFKGQLPESSYFHKDLRKSMAALTGLLQIEIKDAQEYIDNNFDPFSEG